ncbi:MAG TPA: amidase family protein, partial [Catalimonadaceae bacterium]|nr:amidase family protein [Catalimonadaceae bacterium]
MMEYLLPTYYILTTAEASSNLSRFDGVRYGYRHPNPENLEQMYKLTRSQGFGEEVKKRILLGTFTLSADYFDAYFTKAQKVRRLIQESAAHIFSQYDVLLMPTTPSVAFPIGARTKDPMEMYYADVFTVWANLAGVPAVNIPAGFDKSGLPIGIQAHSAWFQEEVLLNFARLLESKQIRNSD